ncbi:myosin light chain kinase, smooth muscle [Aplysia californica]|uniref:Myosin light chain kinase, smooth muscle n=1 Tax=Aplysia californica TaxID=6500 RepID=A0ABM1A555_APLCA|nr:myosin light chain kinase, smooth muscle [Aplysia californica]
MEEAFSSLLDDLDTISGSEGNPSDLDLSDGEELLSLQVTSTDTKADTAVNDNGDGYGEGADDVTVKSGTQNGHVDVRLDSSLPEVNANCEVTDSVKEDASYPSRLKVKITTDSKSDYPSSPGVDVTSSTSAGMTPSPDVWTIEDSGIGLGVDDALMSSSNRDDLKRQRPLSASSLSSSSASTSPLPASGQSTEPVTSNARSVTSVGHNNDARDSPRLREVIDETDGSVLSIVPNRTSKLVTMDAAPTQTTKNGEVDDRSGVNEESSLALVSHTNNKNSKINNNNEEGGKDGKSSTFIGTRSFNINEDDDGGVTMQAIAEDENQNQVVTVRTKKQRTPSNANEELRNTIVERNKVSPGGTVLKERDVIQTKKRLTSRGSNYFQRSVYTTRTKRDKEGAEQVEHDVIVESENKSVSQGQSWGDKVVTHVTLGDPNSTSAVPAIEDGQTSEVKDGEVTVEGEAGPEAESETRTVSPEIVQALKDTTTTEGKPVVLELCVIATPTPSVTWLKDNTPLTDSDDCSCRFDSDMGKVTLTIAESSIFDTALYTCVCSNELGEARSQCRLTVKRRPEHPPVFEQGLSDVTVTEGHSTVLTCHVTEASSVAWYKDGLVQRHSPDFKQTFDGHEARLEVCEVFLDDVGEYSCVAKNEAGEARVTCKLDVTACDSESTVVPMFLTKLTNPVVNDGERLVLECDVIGSPEPHISWLKDGLELGDDRSFSCSYDGRLASLQLDSVCLEDAGVYQCVARNTAGRVSMDATVTVQVKNKAPCFITKLADITVSVGKTVILKCDVTGTPTPAILWRRDGSMVGASHNFLSSFNNGGARLEILGAGLKDAGLYECVAKNSVAEVTCSCQVKVTDPKAQSDSSSAPQNETVTLPPRTTVRRTFKKLSEPRPADVISAVLQRASAAGGGLHRAQSFSPASNSALSLAPTNRENVQTQSNDRESAKKRYSDITAPQTPEVVCQTRESITLTPRSSTISSSENLSSGRDENRSVSGSDSSRSEVSSGSTHLSFPSRRPTNLERSASLHVLRSSNSNLSAKPEQEEGFKVMWSPPGSEESRFRDSHAISGSLEVISESKKSGSGTIPGFRSVSPMFLTSPSREGRAQSPLVHEDNRIQRDLDDSAPLAKIKQESSTSAKSSRSVSCDNSVPSPLSARHTTTSATSRNDNAIPASPSPLSLSSSSISSSSSSLQSSSALPQPSSDDVTPRQGSKKSLQSPRVSELRLQFLKNDQSAAEDGQKKPIGGAGGVRRWHSLPPQENKPKVIKRETPPYPSPATMSKYDSINDEEELHKLMSAAEDFDERKKIRSRLREVRDKQREEFEARKKQREAEAEDLVKRKFEKAEEEKKRKMEAYKQQAPTHERDSKYHTVTQGILSDKQKTADDEKAKKLAAYSQITTQKTGPAGEKSTTTTTSATQKTPGGGTRTVITKKTETTSSSGFGGVQYGKPAADTARELTEQLMRTAGPGVSGHITVKSEAWNSQDGQVSRSEKSQSWGAKPQGAQGAMAAFKQMDAANPGAGGAVRNATDPEDDGGLIAVSLAKKAAHTMKRNAVAIKQEILNFCKLNTAEYQNVEVTNFSSSWNTGMAFCALIHHFYPDAFDFSTLDPKKRRYNFTLAFDTAEQKADIAPLLDVDDMVKMKNPDWKCVFTYVQSMYRHLKDHENNKAVAPPEQ